MLKIKDNLNRLKIYLCWFFISWKYRHFDPSSSIFSCHTVMILELLFREIINACAESSAGPCIPLQKPIENCSKWCVATTHRQSQRSKSNTPIPHHDTTKLFPAATWNSVRRTCVKMPRPTAELSSPPPPFYIKYCFTYVCLLFRSSEIKEQDR